eukprot:tig00021244_g19571.t1
MVPCDCCGVRDYIDDLHPETHLNILKPHGIDDAAIRRIQETEDYMHKLETGTSKPRKPLLCAMCHRHRAEQGVDICGLSKENGIHPTPPSEDLAREAAGLTFPEAVVCSPAVSFVNIATTRIGRQQAAHPKVTMVYSQPAELVESMKPSRRETR